MIEQIDTGDHVHHGPSNEDWVVACVEGENLSWCGWPEGWAKISDCSVIRKATADEREKLLRQMADMRTPRDHRCRYAHRILGLTVLLLLLAVACTPPPKAQQHIPPPPAAAPEVAKPRKITPGPNDRLIHGCIPIKQKKDAVDCICSGMTTRLDSTTGRQTLECKTKR